MLRYGNKGMLSDDRYDFIRKLANKVVALKTRWGGNDTQIFNATKEFCNSYFTLDKQLFGEDENTFRKAIAELIMETKYFNCNCEIVNNIYMNRLRYQRHTTVPLTQSLVILQNLSYCSDPLAICLANETRFLYTLNNILDDSVPKYFAKEGELKLAEIEENLMKSSLGIVNNISMRETTIPKLRNAGMISCLKPYLKSPNTSYALLALASLAGMINEKECDVINCNKQIVQILFDLIRKGMKEPMRRNKEWSCQGSVFIVKLLARNDANIKTLVDLGALELLVEMARIGDYGEQYESVSALWLLCFKEDNQALITEKPELGVYDLLLDLLFSKNKNIKNACNGALWTLRDALKKSKQYKNKVVELLAGCLEGNDANVETLVNLGALEFLVEMARNGNDDEQYKSVSALWLLCFKEDYQALIKKKPELGVYDLLLHLIFSKNKNIKNACNGALGALRDALKKSEQYKNKVVELLVGCLEGNDANVETLVNLGALKFLVEMARNGNDDEQYKSIHALKLLCMKKYSKLLITGKPEIGVVDLLVDLISSENQKIKAACIDGLWILSDALKTSSVKKYREIGKQIDGKHENGKKKEASSRGHVMISYQWADQQVVKNVRDEIKAMGYKVWVDIDDMKGDILQAMAEAVEGADVFLMCVSEKYKHSPACQLEAGYAFKLRKTIIPLIMETGYTADGWLGLLMSNKLYFNFGSSLQFEQTMEALLKELDSVLGGDSAEELTTVICNLL